MKRSFRSRLRRRAFTLLEVMLVLVILVILSGTVGVFVTGAQKKANIRAAKIQVESIVKLLDEYHIDVNSYPTTDQGLAALRTAPAGIAEGKWGGPYGSKEFPPDPWNNPYQYELVSADQFRVWSNGPDGQEGSGDDISS